MEPQLEKSMCCNENWGKKRKDNRKIFLSLHKKFSETIRFYKATFLSRDGPQCRNVEFEGLKALLPALASPLPQGPSAE